MDSQPLFPRCADTCPGSLVAVQLKPDPFSSFAVRQRLRRQPPTPAASSFRKARNIHQVSQPDIDKKTRDRQFPAPESLDSRGPGSPSFSPNSAHTSTRHRPRQPRRPDVPFSPSSLQKDEKEIKTSGVRFLAPRFTYTYRGEDEIPKPGSPAKKKKKKNTNQLRLPANSQQLKGDFSAMQLQGSFFPRLPRGSLALPSLFPFAFQANGENSRWKQIN